MANYIVNTDKYFEAFNNKDLDTLSTLYSNDVRLIDWNVTARSGNPFIKVFEEERELTVMMVVDISSSGKFANEKYQKREIEAEIASVIGF